jgi:hypothetical protein
MTAVTRDYLLAAPTKAPCPTPLAMAGAIPQASPPAGPANAQLVRPGCPSIMLYWRALATQRQAPAGPTQQGA